MNNFKDLYDDLIIVEEEIEQYFLSLANLELIHDSFNYNCTLEALNSAFIKENSLLSEIVSLGYLDTLMTELKEKIKDSSYIRIMLKHKFSLYYRLKERLELFIGGEVFELIYALKANYSRMALGLIANLIDKVDENTKEYLLFYKYSLIYLNLDCENDLINGENNYNQVKLIGFSAKNDFADYLDEGVLLSPSKDNILYLESLVVFADDEINTGDALVAIIWVLAALSVSSKDDFRLFNRFQELLDPNSNSEKIIELINLSLIALEQLKNNTTISR
mgnify:CR=1 FL=1